MTLKELYEKRGKVVADLKAIRDEQTAEGFEETEESRAKWDAVNADIDKIDADIKKEKRFAEVTARQEEQRNESRQQPGREDAHGQTGASEITEEARALAFCGWLAMQGGKPIKDEWRAAAEQCGMQLHVKEACWDLRRDHDRLPTARHEDEIRSIANARENRALSALVASEGGVTVPVTMANAFEVALLYYGGMMNVGEVIRTNGGEAFSWPGANDTGNTGAQVGENGTIGEQDVAFSEDVWNAYKFTSKIVKVPYELMEDSAFDIPSIVGAMLGERLGRILNTKFTTGTGASTPNGIVTASAAGVTAASATAITYDEMIDLQYSVDKAYRDGAKYMFSDTTAKLLRKLKDGNGHYLWINGTGGEPDQFDGYDIEINNDMAGPTASQKSVLFGLLSKYKIRMVRGVRSYRLTELYRGNDQDGFVSFVRGDGNLLNSGGNPVKHLVQSA